MNKSTKLNYEALARDLGYDRIVKGIVSLIENADTEDEISNILRKARLASMGE